MDTKTLGMKMALSLAPSSRLLKRDLMGAYTSCWFRELIVSRSKKSFYRVLDNTNRPKYG